MDYLQGALLRRKLMTTPEMAKIGPTSLVLRSALPASVRRAGTGVAAVILSRRSFLPGTSAQSRMNTGFFVTNDVSSVCRLTGADAESPWQRVP